VKEAANALKRVGADWIIAVGGGSVMDTAKAAWVLYEKPDVELHALTPFDELGLRAKAKLICIPTTTGTGSEATKAIVIRDDETGRKFATMNPELTPDMAILDPEFVVGLPKELTAYTGMDALTHAVEGSSQKHQRIIRPQWICISIYHIIEKSGSKTCPSYEVFQ